MAGMALRAQDIDRIGDSNAVNLSGSLSGRLASYTASISDARRVPLSASLAGNLTLNIYELSLPFSFAYGEQQRSFSQPFNQFGLSPKYKWLTAHVGYRNLSFSPYTLAGHQILGMGAELYPGKLRIGFMQGEFLRAVEEDSNRLQFVQPSYRRSGWAAKIGFGTESDYMDFSVLKAKDDTSSLRRAPMNPDILPGENVALGASARYSITDGLQFYGDASLSAYTRDIRSEAIASTDLPDFANSILTPRISTNVFSAFNAGLNYAGGMFSCNAAFSRVAPDFKSMGAYYINNDLQSMSIAPSLSLAANTLRISATVQSMRDNLQNKKLATTNRLMAFLNLAYNPSPSFGIDLALNTMRTSQSNGSAELNDSLRLSMDAPGITITPRYSIIDSLSTQSFLVNILHQRMIDNNPFSKAYSEYNATVLYLGYSISFTRSALSLNASVNTNRLQNVGGVFSSVGFALGAGKSMLENTLSLNANSSLSLQNNSTVITLGGGVSYRVTEHHSLDANVSFMNSIAENDAPSFYELTSMLSYVFSF